MELTAKFPLSHDEFYSGLLGAQDAGELHTGGSLRSL